MAESRRHEAEVRVEAGEVVLPGELALPAEARGMVLFAHGSGSSRHSPRNQFVARQLGRAGLGTLLLDLLTKDEEQIDAQTRHIRFDVELLAARLSGAIDWVSHQPLAGDLPVGLFGASTGAGAALLTAADHAEVQAVVSRGGRPDLAGDALPRVRAPTLLLVGEWDEPVIDLNREAMRRMHATVSLEIVPRATHLFEEPGALERVAVLASDWFVSHLAPALRSGGAQG